MHGLLKSYKQYADDLKSRVGNGYSFNLACFSRCLRISRCQEHMNMADTLAGLRLAKERG